MLLFEMELGIVVKCCYNINFIKGVPSEKLKLLFFNEKNRKIILSTFTKTCQTPIFQFRTQWRS